VSLTLSEKIEAVAERCDPDFICDVLELTSLQILEAFSEELDEQWAKFKYIEEEIFEFGKSK